MQLNEQLIQLHAQVRDKQAAIEAAAQLLIRAGKVMPEYLASMYDRETQAETYLGQGIAIPHGSAAGKAYVRETAVAVLHVPDGVIWGSHEEVVHWVFAIAASGDEHLQVLRRLARLMNQEAQVEALYAVQTPADLLRLFHGAEAPETAAAEGIQGLHRQRVRIPNPAGFHARPASNLVKLAKTLSAPVELVNGEGRRAQADKMMAILSLGLMQNSEISVESASRSAVEQVVEAIRSGLGDDLQAAAPAPVAASGEALWQPEGSIILHQGHGAADGLALGKIRHHRPRSYRIQKHHSQLPPLQEARRLQEALGQAEQDIQSMQQELSDRLGREQLAIFDAHVAILQDEELLNLVVDALHRGASSESAYCAVMNEHMAMLERLSDAHLAARAVDIRDVRDRVLRVLLGEAEEALQLEENTILCADDFAPSDTAKLDASRIVAFVSHQGGASSHSAILARGLGIAAVVGIEDWEALPEGETAVVDGRAGRVYVAPNAEQLQAVQAVQEALRQREEQALAERHQEGRTADGKRIQIAANINLAAQVPFALEMGAEGVGLMRTEFLYLERESIPDEESQYQAYLAMAQALGERELIIRTLDLGGDKTVAYLNLEKEDNAFLGMRGIRLCLQRPDLFRPQLRAILRAAKLQPNIKVMFPMIATLEEWRQAKGIFEVLRQELEAPAVSLGVMIEVPSAALLATQLAKEVDFFSIGTNDLSQYTLAMDRMNPQLSASIDPLHPAILRLIQQSTHAAEMHGRWVGVCGGAAGDVLAALVLVGLGVTELSVSPKEVPKIKEALRSQRCVDLAVVARQALTLEDAAQVRALLRQQFAGEGVPSMNKESA